MVIIKGIHALFELIHTYKCSGWETRKHNDKDHAVLLSEIRFVVWKSTTKSDMYKLDFDRNQALTNVGALWKDNERKEVKGKCGN
jgi:hypothetical protein